MPGGWEGEVKGVEEPQAEEVQLEGDEADANRDPVVREEAQTSII